ncbi:hypothetical protein AYI68_g325 [Smittium mucronatum]|uniref:Symplekin/Pta1 N-terminal domain-containing protein n=1 Tax=Smittium mucronatum TaxID=133383 RepID=A0A1R0H8P8_9FUNG|nr:hypothetical protein AYI68_g325 [Smittium mucronatum]
MNKDPEANSNPHDVAEKLYQEATNSHLPNSNKLEELLELFKRVPILLVDSYFDHAHQATSINIGLVTSVSNSPRFPTVSRSDDQMCVFIKSSKDKSNKWKELWFKLLNISKNLHKIVQSLDESETLLLDSLATFLATEIVLFADSNPPEISAPSIAEVPGLELVPSNHIYLSKFELEDFSKSSIRLLFKILNISMTLKFEKKLVTYLGLISTVLQLIETRPGIAGIILPDFIEWTSLLDSSSSNSRDLSIYGLNKFSSKCINKSLGVSVFYLFRQPRMVQAKGPLEAFLKRIKSKEYEAWQARQERIKEREIQKEKIREQELLKAEEARIERERVENERLQKEEFERKKLEEEMLQKRLEQDRIEKDRMEKDRLEKERLEKERLEKERLEKERLERRRIERDRLDRENFRKDFPSRGFSQNDSSFDFDNQRYNSNNKNNPPNNLESPKDLSKSNVNKFNDSRFSQNKNSNNSNYRSSQNYSPPPINDYRNQNNRKRMLEDSENLLQSKKPSISATPPDPIPVNDKRLNESIEIVTKFNISQVIDLVLGGLGVLTHQKILSSVSDNSLFDSLAFISDTKSIPKSKSSKSRWSQPESDNTSTQQLQNIQNYPSSIPPYQIPYHQSFPIDPQLISPPPNVFPSENPSHVPIPPNFQSSHTIFGPQTPVPVPDIDAEIDEEDLLKEIEENANRVQFNPKLADEDENLNSGDDEGSDFENFPSEKVGSSIDNISTNILNSDHPGNLKFGDVDAIIDENDMKSDVKPNKDGEGTDQLLETSGLEVSAGIFGDVGSYGQSSLASWKDAVSRLLSFGEILCEQAVGKFGSSSNIKNLPALLRLHIPDFEYQWPLSPLNKKVSEIRGHVTDRERVADWMVLVVRTLVSSINTPGYDGEDFYIEKLDFIYNEVIQALIKTPKQSYEMCLLLLHELYHQVYINKVKLSLNSNGSGVLNDNSSHKNLTLKYYSDWSYSICVGILDCVSKIKDADESIVPLTNSQSESFKTEALSIMGFEKIDLSTSANIGGNRNNAISVKNTNDFVKSVESLVNAEATSYEVLLASNSLHLISTGFMVRFVSPKNKLRFFVQVDTGRFK